MRLLPEHHLNYLQVIFLTCFFVGTVSASNLPSSDLNTPSNEYFISYEMNVLDLTQSLVSEETNDIIETKLEFQLFDISTLYLPITQTYLYQILLLIGFLVGFAIYHMIVFLCNQLDYPYIILSTESLLFATLTYIPFIVVTSVLSKEQLETIFRLQFFILWWIFPLYFIFLKHLYLKNLSLQFFRISLLLALVMSFLTLTLSFTYFNYILTSLLVINFLQLLYIVKEIINNPRIQVLFPGISIAASVLLVLIVSFDINCYLANNCSLLATYIAAISWVFIHTLILSTKNYQSLTNEKRASNQLFKMVQEQSNELHEKVQALKIVNHKLEIQSTEKSNFLATLSHELRTPMNGVLGASQALSFSKLEPGDKTLVDLILHTGKNMNTMLEQLLDYYRVEQGDIKLVKKNFNMNILLTNTIKLLQPQALEKGLELKYIGENVPDWVLGDELRLQQILLNLLSNAIKYTKQGEISLKVNSEIKNFQYSMIFDVEDTGKAIPDDLALTIFKSYYQIEQQQTKKITDPHFLGVGLGLSVCQFLVEKLGGTIKLESNKQEGNCFRVELSFPFSKKIKTDEVTMPVVCKKILLVDDDPLNHQVMSSLCEKLEQQLTSAYSGEQALELINNNFDLVLIDVHMPDMTGEELVSHLRAYPDAEIRNLPLFAFTASLLPEDVAHYKLVFDGVLAKPIMLEQFHELITDQTDVSFHETNTEFQSLVQIKKDLGDNAVQKIVRDGRLSMDESITKIKAYYRTQELNKIIEYSHRLKGAAITLGLSELSNLAQRWEKNGRGNLSELDDCYKSSIARFDQYLAELYEFEPT